MKEQQNLGLKNLVELKAPSALVLAGGYGSRLKPYTNDWPKCLMPVHGLPLLEYWLSELFEAAIPRIIVNTHYKSEIVSEYLKRPRFKKNVEEFHEPDLLGTAGTIAAIFSRDEELGTVIVLHGDNWCSYKIKDLLHSHKYFRPRSCCITMLTFHTDAPKSCGIVEVDERNVVQSLHEKSEIDRGTLANGAVYIIEPEVLRWIIANSVTDVSTQVLPAFLGRIHAVHNTTGFHRDIGTIESLKKSQHLPQKPIFWRENDDWLNQFSGHEIHKLIKNARSS